MEQLPKPPQHAESLVAKSEWSCPICYDDQEDVASMCPCMHRFGLGCAMRWAQQKGNCPLCRTVTRKIVVSALSDNDSFTFEIEGATESSAEDSEDSEDEAFLDSQVSNDDFLMSDDLSRPESGAEDSEEEEEGAARLVPGGFALEVWADFFNRHPDNIRPLLPWLRRELGRIYGGQWREAAVLERSIVDYLCLWGLDEELLEHQLQPSLQEESSTFVQQLIAAAVNLCRDRILQQGQQDPHATGGDNDSPAASSSSTASCEGTASSSRTSSSSLASSAEEEEDGLSEAAEQEQPQEGPEEAAATGPSAPGRGRDPSPEQPQRPPKGGRPAPQMVPSLPRGSRDSEGCWQQISLVPL